MTRKPSGAPGDLMSRLERLVRIESPSRDSDASGRVAVQLSEWWQAAGATVRFERTDAGTSLVAELEGQGDPLLLVGHSDTVWPQGTLEGDVPWSVDGDIVRGPGVYDMKSGLLVMLAAVERLRDRPHRSVRAVVVCDEEIGSPTTRALLRRCAENVAGVIGFESPHPDGALKVGRRGSTRLSVQVQGRASHAALDPGSGISAVDELVDQLLRVREIVADPSLPSEVLCNVGTISGGGRANVVPAQAQAEIGLRFVDAVAERRVLAALAALAPVRSGAVVETQVLSSRPAWRASDEDRAFVDAIAAVGQRLGPIDTDLDQ